MITNSNGLLEPATKQQEVRRSRFKAAVILFLLITVLLLFLVLPTKKYDENNHFQLEPSSQEQHDTATFLSSTGQRTESANSISYGVPFVIVTEGGCSGTTALGKYLRRIVHRHGFNRTNGVHFEFLNAHQNKRSHLKNEYFQDIVRERNITDEFKGYEPHYYTLVQESVQRAQTVAIKTDTLLFFKANTVQYLGLRSRFKALEPVSYVGFYRENVLDRCICMIRDCFYEVEPFGIAVFGQNGTETEPDHCIERRQHPEWNVQAKFTNAEKCLEEDQNRVDVIRGQDFDSFTGNELFRFEKSMSDNDFQVSVDAWMNFLQPLLQSALDLDIVASALEEGRGTHKPSSQERKVYNYMELKEELIGSQKWDSFLHD